VRGILSFSFLFFFLSSSILFFKGGFVSSSYY
jgi:hypothetical protein